MHRVYWHDETPRLRTLKKYGMIPTMGPTGGVSFENGVVRKEFHNDLEKSVGAVLDQCAAGAAPT
jgi:hypothetical protein